MKKAKTTNSKATGSEAASPDNPSQKSGRKSGDWRVEMLDHIRALIHQADPEAVEEVKWRKPSNDMRGVPVWSHGGIICTGETYKEVVKLTFAKGASLPDPKNLFNASLEGNTRRAIDIREGEELDQAAFQTLIKAAVALNSKPSTSKKRKPDA